MLPQIALAAPEPNTSRSASVILMPPPYCTSSEVRDGDPLQHAEIGRTGGFRSVQIDQMQTSCAALLVPQGGVERIFVIDGFSVVVALREPDALAADQVDGRE